MIWLDIGLGIILFAFWLLILGLIQDYLFLKHGFHQFRRRKMKKYYQMEEIFPSNNNLGSSVFYFVFPGKYTHSKYKAVLVENKLFLKATSALPFLENIKWYYMNKGKTAVVPRDSIKIKHFKDIIFKKKKQEYADYGVLRRYMRNQCYFKIKGGEN